jgi:hypothetical protein
MLRRPQCAACGARLRSVPGFLTFQAMSVPGRPMLGWCAPAAPGARSCAADDVAWQLLARGDDAPTVDRVLRLVGERSRDRVSAGPAWWRKIDGGPARPSVYAPRTRARRCDAILTANLHKGRRCGLYAKSFRADGFAVCKTHAARPTDLWHTADRDAERAALGRVRHA